MNVVDQRVNRLYPWLAKARANKTMSQRVLQQLDRIRLLSLRQDKVVINSWDITYHENLKKYEKKTATFVVDDTDEGVGYKYSRSKKMDRKKTSNELSGGSS